LSVPPAAAGVEPEEGAAEEGEAEEEERAPEEEESPDEEPPTGEEKDKSDVVPEEPLETASGPEEDPAALE